MSLAVVAAVGARTPLGLDAVETAFLLRTGHPAMAAAPLVDGDGEQITMCFDPTLDPYAVGQERAALLAAAALEEVARAAGAARALRAKLLLCIDAPVAGQSTRGRAAAGATLAARAHTRARELWPEIELEVCARGAAGAAFALGSALQELGSRRVDVLLLAGAHTDYDPATVAALEANRRLFSPANVDAVLPGEAAAVVLLTRPELLRHFPAGGRAAVISIGTGVERSATDPSVSRFEALGLTSAVRGALAPLAEQKRAAGWTITDHGFESRRIHEWQTMMTRTHKLWAEPHVVDSPAQRIGNLGAAALPLAISLATEGWRRRWAPAPMAVAMAGSEGGERGAVLLSAVS